MSAAHLVYCPSYASYFGFLGAASALVFGNMGAAYGTWKSAVGMAAMAKLPRHRVQPEMVIKSMLPVIMAGVCGIYGLIIAVIIANNVDSENYSLFSGCAPAPAARAHLASESPAGQGGRARRSSCAAGPRAVRHGAARAGDAGARPARPRRPTSERSGTTSKGVARIHERCPVGGRAAALAVARCRRGRACGASARAGVPRGRPGGVGSCAGPCCRRGPRRRDRPPPAARLGGRSGGPGRTQRHGALRARSS